MFVLFGGDYHIGRCGSGANTNGVLKGELSFIQVGDTTLEVARYWQLQRPAVMLSDVLIDKFHPGCEIIYMSL